MSNDFSMQYRPVQAGYNDLQQSLQNQHVQIDIAILDYTNDKAQPTLYELHVEGLADEDNLKQIKENFSFVHNDAFTLIGDVDSHNKAQKFIKLENGNTLSYKHMISVTGNKPSIIIRELSAGLTTLVDALRLGKEVNLLLNQKTSTFSTMKRHHVSQKGEEGQTPKPKLPKNEISTLGVLANAREVLYQIQL